MTRDDMVQNEVHQATQYRMTEPLPKCDCPSCRRAVAILAEPRRVMSLSEAISWGRAYAAQRRRYRTDNRNLTKDDIVLLEGGL